MKNTLLVSAFLLAAYAGAQDPIISSQVRMSLDPLSNAGNETSAATDVNGQEIIAGFNDWRTDGSIKASFGVSSNGGATWSHVMVRPPSAFQAFVEGDPMAVYDRRTNTLFAGAISFAGNGGVYVAKKTAGQNTFQPSVMARVSGGADKGWMACGPIPGNPNTTRLYIVYNEGVIWSDDLGATFTAPKFIASGIGFLPRVGPAGQLYVTYWDFSFGIMFKRSLDGGNTYTTVQAATRMDTWGTETNNGRVPGAYRIPPIHTMAVNPVNGVITIIYFDNTNTVGGNRNLDLYMVKSSNQGTTWTAPQRLPFRPLTTVGDMFFPWAEYTPDGRLHLMAFNSAYVLQNDGIAHGMLDHDYAYSDDDGVSWGRFRLTPNSFDCFNDGRGQSAAFMGDYLGIAPGDRKLYPTYPDTHTGQLEVYTNTVYNPIVRPTSFTFLKGTQTAGTLASLFLKDTDRLTGRAAVVSNAFEAPVQLSIQGNTPTQNPSFLRLYLWSSVSVQNLQQEVFFWNVGTQLWDIVDSRPAPTTETNFVLNVPNPAPYIGAAGLVKAKVAYRQVGPVAAVGWLANFNEAVFLAGP